MHSKNSITAGKDISEAKAAMILVHGRGASAMDIIGLAKYFPIEDFAIVAPQANNNTWYPYSFMAPPGQNEPDLSSALEVLNSLYKEIITKGIEAENIFLAGFSQGACLTAEFVTRNARRFGGVILFTGGLIGDKIYIQNYKGDFAGTPIFIGTGNPDAHVPLERIEETARIMEEMNARVLTQVYNNRPHTISQDEIEKATKHIFNA